MLLKNPDVMLALLHRVNRGLDEFLGRAVSLMASSALSRVAYEIYIETKRFGVKEPNDYFFIDVNERDIAARTGLTRETVNREIRKLKDIQAIKVERRGLIVKDLLLLEKKLYKELL
jgi:CRP-like cAMP-binding protein